MPKWINRYSPDSLGAVVGGYESACGKAHLTTAQAVLVAGRIPLLAVENTSDRGSRGAYAKRWYDWYADPEMLLRLPDVTISMKRRASKALGIRQTDVS